MRGRKPQGCRTRLRHSACLSGNTSYLRKQILRDSTKPLAGLGQPRGVRTSVKKVLAEPFFQRPNATAEGRLSHVPFVRSTREIAGCGKDQEIFEPGEFHCQCFEGIKAGKFGIGQRWQRCPSLRLTAEEPSMKIVEIREKTIPISSPIRNAYIDFSKMTLTLWPSSLT